MESPKVSIGLPVYNGEVFLGPTLNSLLAQDYGDFELIISDNASEDATPEICRGYAEKDSRVRYYRFEENQGAARNFRAVFDHARGEYFKWAAHDDICLPGFLRRCVDVMSQARASVVLVAPRVELIDEVGRRSGAPESLERLDTRRRWPHQRLADVLRTVQWAPAQYGLFRTEALRKTRLIDSFVASDYVLLAELALLGEIWEIPEVLFQRRCHPGVSTVANQSDTEFLAWFDPSKRVCKPRRVRLGAEFVRSIQRLIRQPAAERLQCYWAVLVAWYPRQIFKRMSAYRSSLESTNPDPPFGTKVVKSRN